MSRRQRGNRRFHIARGCSWAPTSTPLVPSGVFTSMGRFPESLDCVRPSPSERDLVPSKSNYPGGLASIRVVLHRS